MNLSQYLGKRVKLIDTDGEITIGKCVCVTPALDNDPEIASIDLQTRLDAGFTIGFNEDEIKSIEVID
ncbi:MULTISPECIES: hypothetical protein [unclassified Paenibacillus]|uniref:hypothetical protein n=1 Tax=unclassified Paenibacillus TaxID=185978 RepID=UPI0008395E31|nr:MULTISPECIES: hypothetical protein [unclassified Paenibacillus]NWL90005.1 hypothetical protein [Paenibacillus sp. 79R4]